MRRVIASTGFFFFLDGFGVATWISRIPEVQTALRLSNRDMGLALLGMALGGLAANAVCVRWTHTLGPSRLGRWSGAAMCCGLPLALLAPSGLLLFAALFALGLCSGCLNVAQNAQAAVVERLEGRRLMVSFHALYSAGGLCGALLGSGMAALHVPPFVHAMLVAATLLAVVTRVEDLPVGPETDAASSVKASPYLALLALMAFCTVMSEGSMGDWSGIYLASILHRTAAQAALGFAAFSVCMLLVRCFGDTLSARLGGPCLVRLGGILAAAGLGATLMGWLPGAELLGFAAVGVGCAATYPLLARAAGSASAIAIVSSSGFIGCLLGPALIGLAASKIGLTCALGLVVASNLVVAGSAHAVENP